MNKVYYSNITNKELQYFHNRPVHNFTVKLSQMLTSDLFQVEEIITDSIYKIYPLFYTGTITSSNPNDRILDNKVIICQKLESTEENNQETFFTFISDENSEIVDYSEYGTYYAIGDQLTESQFNAYLSLLKQNVRHTGSFRISQGELKGSYGTYEFDIDGATLIDNGIIVTDETIASQPKVKLSDNVFRWSSYILKLDIIHYTGVNILDDTTSDFKVVDTLEIELTPNTWVNIPVESLEQDYIISLDATVEIRHDKPEIHMISGLQVNAEPQILQTGETTDITAELLDSDGLHYDLSDGVGKTVYFYELLTPSFTLNATPSIIQTGETSDITCKVKDEDGSIAKQTKVYFYIKEE